MPDDDQILDGATDDVVDPIDSDNLGEEEDPLLDDDSLDTDLLEEEDF